MIDTLSAPSHRIAMVVGDAGVPVLGNKGASVHVRAMANAFLAEGHQPIVVAARRGSGNELACPIHEVSLTAEERAILSDDGDQAIHAEIGRFMLSRVIEEQLRREHQTAPLAAVYERLSIWNYAGVAISRALGIPLIIEANARLVTEQERYRTLALRSLALSIERLVLSSAHAVLAVSQPLADELIAAGADPARTYIVPNGVDPDLFSARAAGAALRAEWGIGVDEIVAGFVGTLRPWHGVDQLIRAAAALAMPRLRVVIVGDGPERERCSALAADLGVEALFTGALPHDAVPAAVAAFDIGVAPYAADAGAYFSPLKVFEYAAAGKAVVAARGGQVEDLFPAGSVALYPPGQIDDLASAIADLASDPETRARLGAAARTFVLEHHTWRHNARQVVRLIDAFASSNRER